MRLKKGFTLAEILIVLMVIGVIATLTVPSMMKGVQDAQYKAAFKKAYNTVSNIYSMVAVEGAQPVPGNTTTRVSSFLVNMLENLSVRDIVTGNFDDNSLPTSSSSISVSYDLNGNTKTVGYSGTGAAATAITETNADSIWVTSDDGISYKIINGSTDASGCLNKTNVIAGDTLAAQVTASCLTVVADVNGVSKRPNTPESQAYIAESKVMDTLTGDQYYIFIARDGVTPGIKQTNVGARIIADVK